MENRQYDNYLPAQEYLGTRMSDDWTETAVRCLCQDEALSWRVGLGLIASDPAWLASCSLDSLGGRKKQVCRKPKALEVSSHWGKFYTCVFCFLFFSRQAGVCVRWAVLDNVGGEFICSSSMAMFPHTPLLWTVDILDEGQPVRHGIFVKEAVKIRCWTLTDQME